MGLVCLDYGLTYRLMARVLLSYHWRIGVIMNRKITFEVNQISDKSFIAWIAGTRVPEEVAFGDSELDAIRRLCDWKLTPPSERNQGVLLGFKNTTVLLCVKE